MIPAGITVNGDGKLAPVYGAAVDGIRARLLAMDDDARIGVSARLFVEMIDTATALATPPAEAREPEPAVEREALIREQVRLFQTDGIAARYALLNIASILNEWHEPPNINPPSAARDEGWMCVNNHVWRSSHEECPACGAEAAPGSLPPAVVREVVDRQAEQSDRRVFPMGYDSYLHGLVTDNVASALLCCGIDHLPAGVLDLIASEIVRGYHPTPPAEAREPEPAVEREAVALPPKRVAANYVDEQYGPADLAAIWNACLAEVQRLNTPPAEAREPEPRGAVDAVLREYRPSMDAEVLHSWARDVVAAHQAQGAAVKCWCETCRPNHPFDMRFIVCPDCGNKRCPRANFHEHACTNSNAVGQPGSSWEHVKPAGIAPPTPARSGEDVRCVHCGQTTMHMGSVCYDCTQSARTATPRPDEGKTEGGK
jgi:hypothetical protein